MTTVTLHIGTYKTGTSYLQAVLTRAKDQLADCGVLWPGRGWADQVAATKSLLREDGRRREPWHRLVTEIDGWDGPSVLVSMEHLAMATPSAVKRARRSLQGHHVRVVLTARDLGRVIPAQWQESVQNGKVWSYSDYLSGVIEGGPGDKAHDHFWSKHDWAHILRVWSEVADGVELVLVTVPPSGAPRGLLWERFCEAVSLSPHDFDSSLRVNESLGAASAEVVRYASKAMAEQHVHSRTSRVLKKTLSKDVLNRHKSDEPSLVLPHRFEEWATARSDELLADLTTLDISVVGSLEELYPRFSGPRPNETEDPSTLPMEQLLAAAGFGLTGLCDRMADAGLAPRGQGPDERRGTKGVPR